MATTYAGRTLDQRTRHDPRSLNHLVSDRLTPVPVRSKFWTPGRTLDQGEEGACTAFGVTGDALASPARVNRVQGKPVDNDFAFAGYNRIKQLDEFPGEDYEGSSVNAAMKWYRELGAIDAWWWCTTMDDLIQALIQLGPAVIGIAWREGMYETRPDGLVDVSGKEVGGHCLTVNGYSPRYKKLGEVIRWKNSWGNVYGVNGQGYVKVDDFAALAFSGDGEVAIPVGRKVP